MTTRAVLAAEIADDLARSDLTSQIVSAINSAIAHYQPHRLFFTESRTDTFVTVVGQSAYGVADAASIPLWFDIDAMFVEDGTQSHRLDRRDPVEVEWLLEPTATHGRPFAYAWFGQGIRLYPIPDAVYTIRPVGHIAVAAPATDVETGNPWMLGGYDLIKCRAKWSLYTHVIHQPEKAADMRGAENDALNTLRASTSQKTRIGRLVSTEF